MADVISSGPEPAQPGRPGRRSRRPTGRRRPPSWLIVLVVAASLTGALRLWGGASAVPDRVFATRPPTDVITLPSRPLGPPARFRLHGVTGNGPAGLRLLIGGDHPTVVDAGTGAVRPLPGLRLDTGQHVTVIRLSHATAAAVLAPDYSPVGLYLVPDGGRAVLLGRDLDGAVADRSGGVIAVASGWTGGRARMAGFAADGRPTWQRPLTEATLLRRDTRYGLLVEVFPMPSISSGGPLLLVDARTGAIRRSLGMAGDVLDTSETRVAWLLGECTNGCPLQITELATGRTERHMLPDGWQASFGAFSPRETMLALSVPGRHELVPARERDGYVAVLSMLTGQLERMPGLTTTAKQAATLAWGPDSQLVLGVHADDGDDRLALWTPGHATAIVLPRRLPAYTAAASLAVLP